MRTLWILAVLLVSVDGSMFNLWKMIMVMTGKEATKNYGMYGCNCGPMKRGKPKDATDQCCADHDCCYQKLTDCDPKKESYSYKFEKGEILCGETNPCLNQACECDKAVATCFRDNLDTYDKKQRFNTGIFCSKAKAC
uniref:Phospholipase A2 n=1 Tax=Calloselasma rhodostoma TaxID=8717 RepID=A0A0H3U266_CALRH|nr:phospholipase A2 [Calloselasma rhodostoma]AHJ09525.1 phospholipase A2 [Calloselasma rhodostoma]AHJ09526.1 phospholipase A2 [Calloselasma rhodostoma]